jgi:hypothetical protein
VTYVEISQNNISSWPVTNFTMSAMIMEFVLLMPLIARCHWKYNLLSSLLINIYLLLRITKTADIHEMRGYPVVIYIYNVIFITLGSYFNERFDRNLFLNRKNDEESLRRFQHIIKSVLPCAILIYKLDNIVFSNRECIRMLNPDSEMDLNESLKEIMITENILEQNLETQNSKFISETRYLNKPTENDYVMNLVDYIKSGRREVNSVSGYENFLGVIKKKKFVNMSHGDIAEDHDRCFDIKISKISWEGADARIIMISEDFLRQKVKYMAEQAQYKDKLLATVSHDLRTPLNGVIGILELGLEEDISPSLKKR